MIPVTSNHHSSAVYLQSGGPGSFQGKTAKALKGVGEGIVHLHLMTLSDAEVLLMTAANEYLSRLKGKGETIIMMIHHLQLLPLAAAEILGCG